MGNEGGIIARSGVLVGRARGRLFSGSFHISVAGPDKGDEPTDEGPAQPKVEYYDVQQGIVLAQGRQGDWHHVQHEEEHMMNAVAAFFLAQTRDRFETFR